MPRLTLSERDRIEKTLVAALAPEDPAIAKLQRAASDAVFREYYGEKALRAFAAMPAEWFDSHPTTAYVKPTGAVHWRALPLSRRAVPRTPPGEPIGEVAQTAIDAWASAYDAHQNARTAVAYRVGSIVGRAGTMQSLLKLLPEARDILALPPEQDPDETAASLNAALAARKAPRPEPTPAPAAKKKPAAKPKAAKKPATR
jgi:hypothetical protein